MKFRTGFVTNSSSTSYTIAKKIGSDWNMGLPEEMYIKNHAIKADGGASLVDFMFERYKWECNVQGDTIIDLCIDHYNGRQIYEEFKELTELIENGFEVYHFSIDRDYEYDASMNFSTNGENTKLIEREDE